MHSHAEGDQPVTAVVRRRVKAGAEASFEALMQEFMAFVLRQPGHLGIHVLRPSDDSREYTVVDRFASEEARRGFRASPDYREWMARLWEVSEAEPEIQELGGIAGWFTLPGRPAHRPPPRPKMAVVTWIGVYPLTVLFPFLLRSLFPGWSGWTIGPVVAALIVVSLTWVVMPALTRVFRKWLFEPKERA